MLLLVAHHMAVDAASWMQIIGDMRQMVIATMSGRELPEPEGTSPRAGSLMVRGTDAPPQPELRARIAAGEVSPDDVAATAAVDTFTVAGAVADELIERHGHGGTLRDALMSALAQAVRATDPWGPHLVIPALWAGGRRCSPWLMTVTPSANCPQRSAALLLVNARIFCLIIWVACSPRARIHPRWGSCRRRFLNYRPWIRLSATMFPCVIPCQ